MACALRVAGHVAYSAMSAVRAGRSQRSVALCPCQHKSRPSRAVRVKAAESGDDFDAVLMKYAEKWEKTENKPVVVAWLAAAFAALFTAEWFIHLPAMDVLLGGPVQLVGLFAIPYLGVRWFMDGVKPGDDVDKYTSTIVDKLPGLKKE